ncbi:hypothetical protein MAC_06753 [Metarhizium acridum CQMa 102]|uniref:Uncharacterized protein n=1 Tax=Metarhizium acridum (strain CQMa 102) TaxID=655827 RepID=E9EA55_METAQ|nr:uncharacterized protein MAC_06753 [Metarhizium acridum CQMa 102]EFY87193.1 hypothetical protein MAC_06753 [Metarhizium acridum CQMa 102]
MNRGEAEPLTLRLDVGESEAACGRANLTVNGQELVQDGNGNGQGTLAAHHGGNFTADWAFSCDARSPQMLFKMQVTQLDDLEIAPFNFSASFTQIVPRQIRIMDGAAVVNRVYRLPQETTLQKELAETTLQDQIHVLDILRIKARQLENAILAQENKIAQKLGQKKHSPSANIQDCTSLDCILEALGGKFRDVTEQFSGNVEELKVFITHSGDGSLPVPADDYEYWYGEGEELDDHRPETYDLKDHKGKWTWVDQLPLVESEIDGLSIEYVRPRRQPPLAMAIALSVIALCLLSMVFILRRHRRTSGLPFAIDNEKVLFSERPRRNSKSEWWAERRARRKARKHAIREYVRNIFMRWCHKTASSPSPVYEESTSIEEELASFREAVSVVDSLVAVEEGRNREVPRYADVQGSVAGCEAFADDESLPPYESEDDSTPVVDGFQAVGITNGL